MRLALALAVSVLGAAPAAAQAAGDRYGFGPSPRAAGVSDVQPAETSGFSALSWAGKARAPATSAPESPNAARPAAPYRDLPPPPSARRVYQPVAYQPFQPQAPYQVRPQQLAALAPPPATLYDAPARDPALAGGPQARRPAPAGPAPVPAPAPQQVAQAGPHAGGQVRFYSLHRGYGLAPDAIPETAAGDRYVLIGPPDGGRGKDRPDDRDDDDDAPPGKIDRTF
ncbi:MAG TPA: hypothetical protein VFW47_03150 [Phenylobacterium sp.]|nr:hypothetical protein [Phenylobacterium sp.]